MLGLASESLSRASFDDSFDPRRRLALLLDDWCPARSLFSLPPRFFLLEDSFFPYGHNGSSGQVKGRSYHSTYEVLCGRADSAQCCVPPVDLLEDTTSRLLLDPDPLLRCRR